jgi:hypothetical protein
MSSESESPEKFLVPEWHKEELERELPEESSLGFNLGRSQGNHQESGFLRM